MKRYIGALLAVILLLMAGCGSLSNADATTMVIGKKGDVTIVLVEPFDKEYYDEKELKQSIQAAVDTYNDQRGSKAVVLEKLTVKKETVKARVVYDSWKDYSAFNGTILFAGTIAEAVKAGYDFQTDFVDASGKTASGETVMGDDQANVIVTNEPIQVQTGKDIAWVSRNVSIQKKKLAAVKADENQDNKNTQITNGEISYIIY